MVLLVIVRLPVTDRLLGTGCLPGTRRLPGTGRGGSSLGRCRQYHGARYHATMTPKIIIQYRV